MTSRQSSVLFDVFAGAGGATDRTRVLRDSDQIDDPFAFSATADSVVTPNDPFSGGAAASTGSLDVADAIERNGDAGFLVTATRGAGGSAHTAAGSASLSSR